MEYMHAKAKRKQRSHSYSRFQVAKSSMLNAADTGSSGKAGLCNSYEMEMEKKFFLDICQYYYYFI